MRRSTFRCVFAAATLCILGILGCSAQSRSAQNGFAGGNGAFGEDPSAPGAYVHDSPDQGQPAAHKINPYAGGNGEFGEDPGSPGTYVPHK